MTQLLTGILILAALVGALIILLWALGARQPSTAISRHGEIIFLALKRAGPDHGSPDEIAAGKALWRGIVAYPFIGPESTYWTDYLLLRNDPGLLSSLKGSNRFEDVFAARVELIRVPAIALGVLRARHLLGITPRPDGPLPDSIDHVEGRRDVLPHAVAVEASRNAPPDMQVTMMNYLSYVDLEPGGRDAGRRLYNRYGQEAMKAVHMVGGQFLFAGRISEVLIAARADPTPHDWDDLAAMVYPDPLAIFYMEQSAAYRRALEWRDQSLERSDVIATQAR